MSQTIWPLWRAVKFRIENPFIDRLSRCLVTVLTALLCSNVMARLEKIISKQLNMYVFLCHSLAV
jgi:hypothetical protein